MKPDAGLHPGEHPEAPKKLSKKTVHYRRCQFQPESAQTLQQLIAAAIAEKPLIGDRTEAVDTAASTFRVLSSVKEIKGMQCGTLLIFERGSYQMVVADDPGATSVVLAAMKPPAEGAVQQQFVPGVLFFVVFEDHVAIVQASSLRTSGLEQHLAWLLRSQSKLLDKDQGFVLADEPKKATRDQIRKSRVKSLSIGRPFMTTVDDPAMSMPGDKKPDVSKLRPDPGMVSVIRNFLPEDSFSSLALDESVFDGDLEVWLEIRYPAYTRTQPEDAAKLLDNLAIALRDQEEDSVELELGDGSRVKGKDLKISAPITLASTDGVPDVDSFYADMADWLSGLLRNGMVSL